MHLKRIYKTPDGWEKKVDKKGVCTNPPPLDYVSLAHTGVSPNQNFSIHFVVNAIKEGWLEMRDDTLELHVCPETLKYKILRGPGRYCCHCDEKLQDDETGIMARLHIAQEHKGEASPDENYSAGYEKLNCFECVLESAQHARHKKHDVTKHHRFPRQEEGEVSNG